MTGGSPRLACGPFGQLGAAGQAQPPGLLVQEAAGARRAGGVGAQAAEAPVRLEMEQGEALPADHQQPGGLTVEAPGRGDLAELPVVDAGPLQQARHGGGDHNRLRDGQLRQQTGKGLPDAALVKGVAPGQQLPVEPSSSARETATEPTSRPSSVIPAAPPDNYRHGPAAELHARPGQAHPHQAAARGGLVAGELALAQALAPEGAQAAVRRAGHRVLVDAGAGGEETRDEIVRRADRRAAGDHDPALAQGRAAGPGPAADERTASSDSTSTR